MEARLPFSDRPAWPGGQARTGASVPALPGAHTYRGSRVLLVSLEGAQPVRDLQQRGGPQLGAAGDEAPVVLHPEAEEGFVTDLSEGQAEPRRPPLTWSSGSWGGLGRQPRSYTAGDCADGG